MGVRVDVESILAQKADQCLSAGFRKFYSQAGRGRHGRDDGDLSRETAPEHPKMKAVREKSKNLDAEPL